jgi:hypothetical protein
VQFFVITEAAVNYDLHSPSFVEAATSVFMIVKDYANLVSSFEVADV